MWLVGRALEAVCQTDHSPPLAQNAQRSREAILQICNTLHITERSPHNKSLITNKLNIAQVGRTIAILLYGLPSVVACGSVYTSQTFVTPVVQSAFEELRMNFRTTNIVMLVAVFALAASVAGFAQAPCGLPNELYCQGWDGTGTLYASQNDPNILNVPFATVYDQFTLAKGNSYYDVESFHFVGGYFSGNPPPFVGAFTLELYLNDNGGSAPGTPLAIGYFTSFNETSLGGGIYSYDLYFQSFDMNPGTYWASVVPDLSFPPQWGWATSAAGNNLGYQCFFGTCGGVGTNFALAVDGRPIPEPGTLIMLGTGILGLAGSLRRKLL
jgi:PEP-CTERM motif